MSTNENVPTIPDNAQKRPSALELGPRKKACVPKLAVSFLLLIVYFLAVPRTHLSITVATSLGQSMLSVISKLC